MSFLSSVTKSELNSNKHKVQEASQDVLSEFKSFLSDVEDHLYSASSLSGEDLAKAKAQLKQRVKEAKSTIGGASGTVLKQAQKTAAITNNYVHEQPWAVLGAGVALSLLAGFLIARREH